MGGRCLAASVERERRGGGSGGAAGKRLRRIEPRRGEGRRGRREPRRRTTIRRWQTAIVDCVEVKLCIEKNSP